MKTLILNRISQLFLLVFLASNWCQPEATGGSHTEKHRNSSQTIQLALSIRAGQREFRMSDTLHLETQLTNTSADTLYLFDGVCWNPGNLLNIHAFDIHGKEVSGKSNFLRDCLPPPPARDDASRFIKLEPGTFYGVTEKFIVRELVPEPGEYIVVVNYRSGLSEDWILKYGGEKITPLPIWTSDYPELSSNRLRLVVKP